MLSDPTTYVRNAIANFKIPLRDKIASCLFRMPGANKWDAAISVSVQHEEIFYPTIYDFWVAAFFTFVEDTWVGPKFYKAISSVDCHEMSDAEFQRSYFGLLTNGEADMGFLERQRHPETHVELKRRNFSRAVSVLRDFEIRSAAALGDKDFVAYFISAEA